jgi:hypothetical protein
MLAAAEISAINHSQPSCEMMHRNKFEIKEKHNFRT